MVVERHCGERSAWGEQSENTEEAVALTGPEIGLVVSVFLACSVEAVEALTIVLAVGTTRSWPSTLAGVGAAVFALAAIVVVLGPAVTSLPIGFLRVVVGGLLLIFGLQWLRKAILRAAGAKDIHDELKIYDEQAQAASTIDMGDQSLDSYALVIAFKGMLLEGLEVAFIVLTFGANQHDVGLAAIAAGVATVSVVLVGFAVRAPLSRVPENTMKFAVGVMLSSFGMFWGAQGAGAHWPGGDVALLVIVPAVLAAAVAMVLVIQGNRPKSETSPLKCRPPKEPHMNGPRRLALSVSEFVVGDDWRLALGVATTIVLTALVAHLGFAAWWVMSVSVLLLLAFSSGALPVSVHPDRTTRARDVG